MSAAEATTYFAIADEVCMTLIGITVLICGTILTYPAINHLCAVRYRRLFK